MSRDLRSHDLPGRGSRRACKAVTMHTEPHLVWKAPAGDRFPRPDWSATDAALPAGLPDGDLHRVYGALARQWVDGLRDALGGGYRVHGGGDWLLLSHECDRYVELLLQTLRRDRRRIARALDGLADDDGYGPHVLLLIEDLDDYYAYVAHFYPRHGGAYAQSAGMFVDDGYGHLIVPHRALEDVEAVTAHELTHAMLRDLRLPLWLDEGIASNMEQAITGRSLYPPEPELIGRLIEYWRREGLEPFWSGASFARPDQGSELSYALASHVVAFLGGDYPRFREFARAADPADAGNAAAREVYGEDLGALMRRFLGDGDWTPRPATHSR
ncbi:hypothetical protein [Rehaibacterium terrae]|jgi:hypothetical protein|uniref:DUF1570 domain-containing protein n=1 Tax=Rehaibacterium terrae TaxID=1341696 RepID=A0A7W7Y047_9GAMM|nr:hypothetical protein [Rehaibacterium terrae]MBB5015674.1 hypothetical protein [Rehaibacterium terrae]